VLSFRKEREKRLIIIENDKSGAALPSFEALVENDTSFWKVKGYRNPDAVLTLVYSLRKIRNARSTLRTGEKKV